MKKKIIVAIILEILIVIGFSLICFGVFKINANIGIITIGASILIIVLFEIFTNNK